MKQNSKSEVKGNPLLAKIQSTIAQSDPRKWERFGEDLVATAKYEKPRDAWEIVYCITIPSGILAFRSSQPVTAQYFGGGYTITPIAEERFSVELRPRAWDPRTLVDPYYRAALDKDRQFQLLADGEIAKTVFSQIKQTVASFSGEKSKEIRAQIEQLTKTIVDRAAASESGEWSKSEPDLDTVHYQAQFDGIDITLEFKKQHGLEYFHATYSKDGISIKPNDAPTAKTLYEMIKEKCENSALEALSKVLDSAGF